MNIEQYPTPETDAAILKYEHPDWPSGRMFTVNEKPVVKKEFADDLERRLAACRAFINEVHKSSSSSRLVRLAKETLTLTKP